MDLDIPWYSFSVTFLQILSVFMFMEDKQKEEKRIGYKGKKSGCPDAARNAQMC